MYSKQDFEKILDAILAEVKPARIMLFGSYATGNQTQDSDIDIIVLTQEELSRRNKLNLLTRIEKRFLQLNYPIDLVLKSLKQFEGYKSYPGTLNYDVNRDGKILWMKS